MGTKKQMTQDDTGFLWQNLARYKRAKERGQKSAKRFLDETYENFGFSEPLCTKRRIPHAYIYSADGSLASRFRIDSQDIPEKLSTLYKTDMPLGKYEAQIIAWAKKSPARMIEENCHTNWDSMRAAWQNSFEEMYS